MSNGDYYLAVDGSRIWLRRNDNMRLITPARDEHPATVAARLSRSSRLALDPTFPPEFLVVRGERQKLEEVATYPDIQNTRATFQDPQGNLLVLTNDILISFVDGSSDEDRERLLARFDGRVIEQKAEVWTFRVNDAGADAPLLLANALSNESIVKYAEPNALQALTFQQFLPQNEPGFQRQWHLQNTGQNGGTVGADVDALGAWAITTGSRNIKIVVIDSGVDIYHPDLAANMDPGWDFDHGDDDPTNNNNAHGTACAGIIAAAANGWGVTGIAPGCRIIPVKISGFLQWFNMAKAIDWAAPRGHIISCSWESTPSNLISDAIRRAVRCGVTVFCATGNNCSPTISFPASMTETIAVGASTNEDVRASYSQYGNGLDIVAPSSGGTLRIETTDNQGPNGYNPANSPFGDHCNAWDTTGFSGTSAATPLAAGVAALMLSVDPGLTPDGIRQILRGTATKIDAANANYDWTGWSTQYGYGRINAAAAVARVLGAIEECARGGPYDAITLGTLRGPGELVRSDEGDVTLDRVADSFALELTSLHGSIRIRQKVDQHSKARLEACGTVTICEKVDQHSRVEIRARGDVTIGQKVDQHSQVEIESSVGGIEIGEKIDQESQATLKARRKVHIGQKIDQHSRAEIVADGDVVIGEGIDQHSNAEITSLNGEILIGKKINEYSQVKIVAAGDVVIGEGIDQHSNVEITSLNGAIRINKAVDGNAHAVLRAPNAEIMIREKVAGGATVEWSAQAFTCPDTSGGTVTQI
jgi:subtilisin family serine protease